MHLPDPSQHSPSSPSRRQFVGTMAGASLLALAGGRRVWAAQTAADGGKEFVLENAILRLGLSVANAGVTVIDKRSGLTWRQQIRPGFRAPSLR